MPRGAAPADIFLLLSLLKEQHLSDRVIMNTVSAVSAAQTTSTSSCEDEKGAQSLKVRACMRLLSAAFDATPCSLACQRGCPWLPGCTDPAATFLWQQAVHAGSLERHAPPRPPRWQDASFWWTRRDQRESGATGAPRLTLVAVRSGWSCVGPCERQARE